MRIIEMYPDKVRTDPIGGQPLFRMLDHLSTTPFDTPPARFARRIRWKVIVEVESTIETRRKGLAVQDHRAYKGCGFVLFLLQQLGPCGVIGCERDREISDAVDAGQESREYGCV